MGQRLGTPISGNLINCTGYKISSVDNLGTNVATFLGNALPSAVVTFLGTPSSANLRSALTDETGTGAAVFATSPEITTPTITGVTSGAGATSGEVGEVAVSSGTTGTLTSTNPISAGNVVLSAGDWDISAQVQFNAAGGTNVTDWYASISTTSANIASPIANSLTAHERVPASADHSQCLVIPPTQVLPTGSTTYHINVRGDFTGTAPTVSYVIRARRMR